MTQNAAPARNGLAQDVLRALEARDAGLVLAESCTGGRLAHRLSCCDGAARRFHGSFVVYTKQQKTMALGVPAETIAAESAVSAAVARAMAEGALARSPADFALSITGVAGPEPDEDGNPVGLVWFGLARRGGATQAMRQMFRDDGRAAIEAAAMNAALSWLEETLSDSGGGD